MSTFGGQLNELENVLIDNFQLYNSHTCFFLSHCHTDHMTGLHELFSNLDHSNHHLYCSSISRLILLNKFRFSNKNLIKELTSPSIITVPGNDVAPSYEVFVTPIPAGHCAGSLMFLFETGNKTILYTGDFRILKNDINKFKPFHNKNQIKSIDKVYFDSTFLNEIYWDFPTRTEVVAELLKLIKVWISKSPTHNAALKLPALYGYEFIFAELGINLKCKIHVKDLLFDIFWNVPEIGCFLTKDCNSTKLHAFGTFDKKCRAFNNKRILKIKLSAQWYKTGNANPNQGSMLKNIPLPSLHPIWKKVSSQNVLMCYSTHCSCSELVNFLSYLKPKSLEPCTTALHSTKENTKAYIEQLICLWNTQKREDGKESGETYFQLEKNYKFTLKFPPCEAEDFDDLAEFSLKMEKN